MWQQNALFFNEEDAIEELRKRGYRVFKPSYAEGNSVSSIQDLIGFFYAKRMFYNPDRKFPESIDYGEDRKCLSSLVASRQKLGLSRVNSIKECADIIDALFKYEKILNLEYPVSNTAILTSRPFVDKLCSFLNGEAPEAVEQDSEEVVADWNKYYNDRFSSTDLEYAAQQRKKILERVNEQKGSGSENKRCHQGN